MKRVLVNNGLNYLITGIQHKYDQEGIILFNLVIKIVLTTVVIKMNQIKIYVCNYDSDAI